MTQERDLPPLTPSVSQIVASMLAPWVAIGRTLKVIVTEFWFLLLFGGSLVPFWLGQADAGPLVETFETTVEFATLPVQLLFGTPLLEVVFLLLTTYLIGKMLVVGPRP